MAASARRPEGRPAGRRAVSDPKSRAPAAPSPLTLAATAAGSRVGALLLRNPLAVGSGTAFLVALSFVSANAVWGQKQSHAGAFFPTRALSSHWDGDAATTGAIAPPAPRPASDPTLRRVQAELGLIGLYSGVLDGLPGPATRRAVAAFQERNGMKATGEMDGALLALLQRQADATRDETALDSAPAREAAPPEGTGSAADRQTAKVQAGLKAFGIDGIEVDGVMGNRTRAGIREFQSMFGLPETGEADETLLAKMRETGLAD